MNRSLTLAVTLGALAAAVPSGFADGQPVDQGRAASTSIALGLGNGETLQLDVLAGELSAGPQLSLQAARCDKDNACSYNDFASALPAGALSIDPQTSVAELSTTLDGRRLLISWKPGNGAEVGSGHVEGDGAGFSGSNFVGAAAVVTAQYAGDTCQGSGGVGDGTVVDVDPTDSRTATPVDQLLVPADVTLRC